jgi:membrane protease YdiL (CAAX protease family)
MSAAKKPLIKYGWLRALLFLIPWLIITYFLDLAASLFVTNVLGLSQIEMGDNIQTLTKYFIGVLGTVLVIWLWRKFIDRQTLGSLGFEWKDYAGDAWMGFFTAPALLGIGTLILLAFSYLQFGDVTFDPLQLTIEFALMVLIAFTEELVIRGYLLNNLLQSFNKWIALAISSAFFAVMHLANPDASLLSIANILAAGFLLGINYVYTKNLWFGVFLHFAWNFFQGPVFGYDVSGIKLTSLFQQNLSGPVLWTGGPFGFEGSLLCPILMLLAILVFAKFFSTRYTSAEAAVTID